jgi:hypothetical protein
VSATISIVALAVVLWCISHSPTPKLVKNQLLNAVNNSNGDQIDYRPDGDVLTDS